MYRLLLVAIGGAVGSVLRYLLSGFVQGQGQTTFPIGTFAVNVLGCLAVGFLAGLAFDRGSLSVNARTNCSACS